MIEGLNVPLDQWKIQTIVLGMTPGAFLARTSGDVIRGMQSSMSGELGGDLCMAIEALQGGLPPEFVATSALCRTVEGLVRPRKRSGRNLRQGPRRDCQPKEVQKRGE